MAHQQQVVMSLDQAGHNTKRVYIADNASLVYGGFAIIQRGACPGGAGATHYTRPVGGHEQGWIAIDAARVLAGDIKDLPVIVIPQVGGGDHKAQRPAFETGKLIIKGIYILKIATGTGRGYCKPSAKGDSVLKKNGGPTNRQGSSRCLPECRASVANRLPKGGGKTKTQNQ